MIYLLYGENDYQIDRRIEELKADFARQHGAENIVTIDVAKTTSADLMRQLTAISLFSTYQLIIVQAITSVADNWTMLEANLDYIPDTTTVILTDVKRLSKVRNLAVTRTFKKLKATGAKLEKFDAMRPANLRSWLRSELNHRHLTADSATQAHLIKLTAGEDNPQARLTIELDKLSLITNHLTMPLVDMYVEPSLATNAFAIFGAAWRGDAQQAVTLTRQLSQTGGEDINRFIGLLASQELALAAVITGADELKITPYQMGLARDMALDAGDHDRQLAKLCQVATILAKMDAEVKKATPEEGWLQVERAIAAISAC